MQYVLTFRAFKDSFALTDCMRSASNFDANTVRLASFFTVQQNESIVATSSSELCGLVALSVGETVEDKEKACRMAILKHLPKRMTSFSCRDLSIIYRDLFIK